MGHFLVNSVHSLEQKLSEAHKLSQTWLSASECDIYTLLLNHFNVTKYNIETDGYSRSQNTLNSTFSKKYKNRM